MRIGDVANFGLDRNIVIAHLRQVADRMEGLAAEPTRYVVSRDRTIDEYIKNSITVDFTEIPPKE
jgi:hypothetical protein